MIIPFLFFSRNLTCRITLTDSVFTFGAKNNGMAHTRGQAFKLSDVAETGASMRMARALKMDIFPKSSKIWKGLHVMSRCPPTGFSDIPHLVMSVRLLLNNWCFNPDIQLDFL
jgi:hypothetical protein